MVLAGGHGGLHVTLRTLRPDEGGHVVTDVIHQDGVGLQHVAHRVVVDEVQLHIGEEAGAVIDLLHGVLHGSGDGETLGLLTIQYSLGFSENPIKLDQWHRPAETRQGPTLYKCK